MNLKVELSNYDNHWYKPGSILKRNLWYVINRIFFKSSWIISSSIKIFWLKLFGAQIGKGVVIKPNVNIKFPWKLNIGNYCWIGQNVWIVNLDKVTLEDNVCVSQGAMLMCGNHNYKSTSFDLMIAPIYIENGSWIGANSTVGPGVLVGSHAVLCLGAVAYKNLDAYTVYNGCPAMPLKKREILK